LLLEVQEKDTRLSQLAHRAATLPESGELSVLRSEFSKIRDQAAAAEIIASDLRRELAKAELDVESVRERSRKDSDLMDSGSISDPKQLQNLQKEVESLARRQSDLEDVELEIMERLDGANAAVTVLADKRDALAEDESAMAARVARLMGEINAERAEVEAERAGLAAGVPADLLTLFEKVRADHNGLGAARIHRGRCEGCRLELPPTDIESIRAAAPDEVLRCEECRRILVRTPESGL
jgi:predicted  nucleic acid-binding Zn-ribbon protein